MRKKQQARWLVATPWIAVLTLAAAVRGAPVQIDLPRPVTTGETVRWGIYQSGLLLGESRTDFTGDHSTIQIIADIEITGQQPAPVFWATVDQDEWPGHLPGHGELFQRLELAWRDGAWRPVDENGSWQRHTFTSPDALLTIHYHRTDAEYENVSLWTWDEHLKRAPEANELRPIGRDAFGMVFQIDIGRYGEPGDGVGMVPRRNADWQLKDGGDRMWRATLGRQVWLVQNDNRLYAERPDVSPKVQRVAMDAEHNLTIRFSHRLPVSAWTPDRFKLRTSAGEALNIKAVYPFAHRGDACALYSLEIEQALDYPNKAYALEVDGYGVHNVAMGHLVKDPDRFYDADARLGARYAASGTTFGVFAPGAVSVRVVVAESVEGGPVVEHVMSPRSTGVWEVTVPGDWAGHYYAYKLGGIGFDADVEVTDIYATCTQARFARSLIVDLRATDPPGFREHTFEPPASPVDAVVYEMHVRDFTISPTSGVSDRGKYLGLTERGTRLPSDPTVSTALDHLVELGVTHVQIMPVQDFDNHEHDGDSYNWGYMPVHFNSPDGWFAQSHLGPGKITELKAAIQAFHGAGIGVILDVVYNHTADWAPFEKLVPGYYFRLTQSGNFSNGSGCGNEFASEHPMARKFILDSVRYWVEEYKVDGFRFDLMGLIDLDTMKQIKAELAAIHPNVLVYGEPWTGGSTPLKPITSKDNVRGTGIGAFNDNFRDAIKGGRDGGAPGFIQCGNDAVKVVEGLMGSVHDWAQDPVDSINYFEAHDNLTSWDKLLQSVPHGGDPLRERMMRLATLALLSSQGLAFVHSGQEFCRSKQGNNNSYNAPDEINQVNWSLKSAHRSVFDYTRGMIALRKAHPAFRLRTRAEVEKRIHFLTPPDGRMVLYEIDAAGLTGESAERILVVLNGAPDAMNVSLPEGNWSIHADGDIAGLEALRTVSGDVSVPAHGGMLLVR